MVCLSPARGELSQPQSLLPSLAEEHIMEWYTHILLPPPPAPHTPPPKKKISGFRGMRWQPTAVFLPGEFHGQRSPAGYSPWGPKSPTRLSD